MLNYAILGVAHEKHEFREGNTFIPQLLHIQSGLGRYSTSLQPSAFGAWHL